MVEHTVEHNQEHSEAAATPPWERVRSIFSDVPEEEKERLPADLSENLDHYIYGTARKGQSDP
jgi:hypothetical protein